MPLRCLFRNRWELGSAPPLLPEEEEGGGGGGGGGGKREALHALGGVPHVTPSEVQGSTHEEPMNSSVNIAPPMTILESSKLHMHESTHLKADCAMIGELVPLDVTTTIKRGPP